MTFARSHCAVGSEADCRSRCHKYDTILSLRFYEILSMVILLQAKVCAQSTG